MINTLLYKVDIASTVLNSENKIVVSCALPSSNFNFMQPSKLEINVEHLISQCQLQGL
jgi:hypothetical protein